MTPFFNRLFNIRSDEWPRLLLLYSIFLIYITGATWGETIVAAAFLQQVGVEFLPWVFVVIAVASIPATAVYTAFADRMRDSVLMIAILAIGMAGIFISRILLAGDMGYIAYPLLYLLMHVPLSDVFVSHWYTYTNSFYDTRSAKRIIPILSTSGRVGSIIAGLSMPLLNQFVSPANIITIWLCALILVVLLARVGPYLLKEDPKKYEQKRVITAKTEQKANKGFLKYYGNIREGYQYVSKSGFLLWMSLFTLILMMLDNLIQFRISQVLVSELQSTERISNFIGLLTGISNLVMLPVTLFLVSRIITRIGLDKANLIFPAANLFFCGGLVFIPSLITAAFAHFGSNAFRAAFRGSVENLLYNAVPLRVKGRARAFISGLVAPLGSLLGGGLLLILPLLPISWLLAALIGALAIAYMVCAWVIRKQYSHALITMLEQEDYSFLLLRESADLAVADPATLNWLRKKLRESTSHELTVFIAQIVSQIGGDGTIPILREAVKAATDPRTRSAIIDVLTAADLRYEAVRSFYAEFLSDPDGQVRQSALAGLEQIAEAGDKEFLSLALQMLEDPDMDVRVRVLVTLAKVSDVYDMPQAVKVLNELLTDTMPLRRAQGVRVLGQTCLVGCDEYALERLIEYLADPADEVRLRATLATETLPATQALLKPMIGLLQDPIERVRQAAVTVLGRIQDIDAYDALLNSLVDPSPQVRTTAVDALVKVGRSIIPVVHTKLDSPNSQLRKMTTAILSRVNPSEYGSLVKTQITGNLLIIYKNHGRLEALKAFNGFAGLSILRSVLHEQNLRLTEEIFYLLSAIHNPADVKIISESLHSEDAHVRINAVEALESLTTPQTADLISPLFEPELPPAQLLSLSKATWDMEHPDAFHAFHQLLHHSDDSWMRAITTFTLGEMGAILSPKQEVPEITQDTDSQRMDLLKDGTPGLDAPAEILTKSDASQDRRRRTGRRSMPADLFGALTDAPKDTPSLKLQTSVEANNSSVESQREPQSQVTGRTVEKPALSESEKNKKTDQPLPSPGLPFTLSEIETMLNSSLADPAQEVRLAAQAAKRKISGIGITSIAKEEGILLSAIERIIFLKEVPFFRGMTIEQLKVLSSVCEERLFEKDTRIFNEGETGGVLYVVVSGRVGIEQEKRKGYFVRLATIEAHSYFGEADLFENSPRATTAIALLDTLTLCLHREPLIALARQYPDLSLELINVLSQRLRQVNERIAELTRTRPRELHKLFDQYEQG